jgi:CubicO group peptidase (beta-lactamase class C family)
MRRLLSLFLFAALAALSGAQEHQDRTARVRAAVEAYLAEKKVTGASVAIAKDGKIVFEQGFGLADVEHDVPYRAETVTRLASVSKTITAVAFMQLVEAGKLDLDEDIRKYVPEFPDKGEKITARHLLTHTSGVRHYKANEAENQIEHRSVAESFKRFVDDPLVHKPGAKFTYSTYAFNLLARAVETASGMDFRDYLAQKVFQPAGMEASGPEDLRRIVEHRARGYRRLADGRLVNSDFANVSYKWAGGGMVSTAPDLCRFGIALLEGKLMKRDTLALMWTDQKVADPNAGKRLLGWAGGDFNGNALAQHGGAQQGSRTYFIIVPADRLVAAILTNYESHNIRDLAVAVRDAWYAERIEFVAREVRRQALSL